MLNRILGACASLAAAIIGTMVVLVSYDVIARNLGLWSPGWMVDATEYGLPLATLLVAPWLASRGEHIRIDLVAMVLPKAAFQRLDRITSLGCAIVCAVTAWYSVGVAIEAYETGALVIKSVIFPEWWIFAPLPACFLLLALEFLRRGFAGTGDKEAACQAEEKLS